MNKKTTSALSYSDKLKNPKWQRKRLEIMKRDKFTCKLCKDTETTLQVHHKEYINGNDPWDYDNSYLITLCEHCHTEIEDLKGDGEEISYGSIAIYKSDHWSNKSRMMFISHNGICTLRIYDKDNCYIVGFNIDSELGAIIKILRKSQLIWPKDLPIQTSIKSLS